MLESEGAWQNHGLHTDEAVEQVLEVGFAIRCFKYSTSTFFEAIAIRPLFEPWVFKEVYTIDRRAKRQAEAFGQSLEEWHFQG